MGLEILPQRNRRDEFKLEFYKQMAVFDFARTTVEFMNTFPDTKFFA
jgi:hypothetical protein